MCPRWSGSNAPSTIATAPRYAGNSSNVRIIRGQSLQETWQPGVGIGAFRRPADVDEHQEPAVDGAGLAIMFADVVGQQGVSEDEFRVIPRRGGQGERRR